MYKFNINKGLLFFAGLPEYYMCMRLSPLKPNYGSYNLIIAHVRAALPV
jgi:hypothetical protein